MELCCDVLVVGGGAAGIGAAVAAARGGVHTVLIEKNNFPGGIAVTGLHRFICGLYANGTSLPDDTLNEGIIREVCFRLKSLAPKRTVLQMGKVYVLPCVVEDIMSVFRSLIGGEKHLDVFYSTQAVSVNIERGAIIAVIVRNLDGDFDIIPRVVIDCSGVGVIVQLSGARYRVFPPHQRQLAGYTFRVKGLQEVDDMVPLRVPYCLSQAVAEKKMPIYLRFTTFIPGDDKDEGYCRLSIPPVEGRNRNKQARNDALLVHSYLSRALPIFRDSFIENE